MIHILFLKSTNGKNGEFGALLVWDSNRGTRCTPHFYVTKNLRLFSRWVSPYIRRIHPAYICEDSSIVGTLKPFGDYSNQKKHWLVVSTHLQKYYVVKLAIISPGRGEH